VSQRGKQKKHPGTLLRVPERFPFSEREERRGQLIALLILLGPRVADRGSSAERLVRRTVLRCSDADRLQETSGLYAHTAGRKILKKKVIKYSICRCLKFRAKVCKLFEKSKTFLGKKNLPPLFFPQKTFFSKKYYFCTHHSNNTSKGNTRTFTRVEE
jgi:hypothetical protein